jgi:hypothetical protein
MAALTPQITLTADLESILAGAQTAGYLRITLCGFGPIPPNVPGTCMLADAGIPQIVGPQVGATQISILLYGNDVIQPLNADGSPATFYEIAVLDSNKNVIQSANYRLTGAGTQPLPGQPPIVPPYGSQLSALQYLPCAGAVPGNAYVAPGVPVMVFYNGVALPMGQALPWLSYTISGTSNINLNFATQTGVPNDRIDALCVVGS